MTEPLTTLDNRNPCAEPVKDLPLPRAGKHEYPPGTVRLSRKGPSPALPCMEPLCADGLSSGGAFTTEDGVPLYVPAPTAFGCFSNDPNRFGGIPFWCPPSQFPAGEIKRMLGKLTPEELAVMLTWVPPEELAVAVARLSVVQKAALTTALKG
jgi:hypothetical protein